MASDQALDWGRSLKSVNQVLETHPSIFPQARGLGVFLRVQ